jgi:hypothetical protein
MTTVASPVLRCKSCAAWKIGSCDVCPRMALALDCAEQPLVLIRQTKVSMPDRADNSRGCLPLECAPLLVSSRYDQSPGSERRSTASHILWCEQMRSENACVPGERASLRPLFRVPTRLATAAHLVPSSSTALKRRSSSSALQEPFETRVAICAHHRLRQSLLVRLGMCFAMACHLDGGFESPSSVR